MIKVLYVARRLIHCSGTTSFIMNYFRHIDHTKVRIDLLTFDESDVDLKKEFEDYGSKIYQLSFPSLKSPLQFYKQIKKFFQVHGGKYDIVQSNMYQIDCLIFHLAKQKGTKICISHSHVTSFSDYSYFSLRALRNKLMALPVPYCADVWAACNNSAGDLLFGKIFSQSPKRWILHNAIDIRKFMYDTETRTRIRNELEYGEVIVLGNIGALQPVKNQGFLLRVLQSLLRRGNKQYRLLLVGDGPLRGDLENAVLQMGLKEYVTFTGVRSDVPQLLQALDIFLMPSHHEGFPITCLEAQAAGLSCLLSEKIPRDVGIVGTQFLSVSKGAEVWADRILHMETIRSRNNGEILKAAGYDIETEAKKMLDKYTELLAM